MDREVAETLYCSISSSKRAEWVELLSKNPCIPVPYLENLLQSYRYTHPAVLKEVLTGLKHGLSAEQVSLYGQPCYNEAQMKEIRLGLENLKDASLVKLFSKVSYSSTKMRVARELFESGFEADVVSIYLDTCEYSYTRLEEIELGIRHGLNQKQILYYAKDEYTNEQMHVLRLAFESGMDFKEIHIFAKAKFDPEQMTIIRDALLKDKLPINMVNLASRVCFDINQMYEIIDGIKLGLTREQIELYADPRYTMHHMRIIKNILKLWPKDEELISKILDPDFSYGMLQIIESTIDNEFDLEIIKFIVSNKSMEMKKFNYLISALDDELPFEDVKELINYDVKVIPYIIDALKCNISLESIQQAKADMLIIEDFIQAEIAKKLRTLLFAY